MGNVITASACDWPPGEIRYRDGLSPMHRPVSREMPAGMIGFEEDCRIWRASLPAGAEICSQLISHVLTLLPAHPELRHRFAAAWGDRHFSSEFARPHLLCAALHADALRSESSPLFAAMLTYEQTVIGAERVADALAATRTDLWQDLASRSVQTNEIRRAICWRLPVSELSRTGRGPFVLVDIGCSAGLNLVADRLPASWTADGAPMEFHPSKIMARIGLDREPLDPAVEEDANWLRACVVPSAWHTHARLDAALAAARNARIAGELELAPFDLRNVLVHLTKLSERYRDATIVAYHTAFLPFLDETTRWLFEDEMRSWTSDYGARAVWAHLEIQSASAPSVILRVVDGANSSDLDVASIGWDCTQISIHGEALAALRAAR